jgi:hypothetical protein
MTEVIKKKRNKIDKAKAAIMLMSGASKADVARKFNVSSGNINAVVDPFLAKLRILPNINKLRLIQQDVYDSAALRFVAAATESNKIKKASLMQCASAAGIMFDKSRILQGLSTQNVALHTNIQAANSSIDQAQEQLKMLMDRLQVVDSKEDEQL